MKNTTFKKRALISSIAMLLVALVALGSATFAWFAANPDASASGVKMHTTASSGLVIRTDSDDTWDHDVDLNATGANFDLRPACEKQGDGTTAENFYTYPAQTADEYTMKTDSTAGTTATFAGYSAPGGTLSEIGDVYREKVYFRLSDNAKAEPTATVKIKKVTITPISGANLGTTIKVAIADKTGKLIGTYAADTSENNNGSLQGNATKVDFSPALTASGASVTHDCGITGLTTATTTNEFVTVYVYIDGQHKDCWSNNVGSADASQILDTISIDFSLVIPAA